MRQRFRYRAYGFGIDSEIECPELFPDPNPTGEAEVSIRLLDARSTPFERPEGRRFTVDAEHFQLTRSESARYRVEEGKRVVVEPVEGADPEEIRLFLLGSTMGALLYQRGLFPLHGSAVDTPWGGMVFVGTQGIGKSTLASEFHRRGYRLLSDDICAVGMVDKTATIFPALAQFRLCPDAYQRIGSPEDARFNVDKFVVPMGDQYCIEQKPLRAVHILNWHDEDQPAFTALQGIGRIQHLLGNLYRLQFLEGQATKSAHLQMAATIAQSASIISVSRKRDTGRIGDLVDFLEAEWQSLYESTQEKV